MKMNGCLRIANVAACPFPDPRKAATRVQHISAALVARGHIIHVVTYHGGQEAGALPFEIHRTPVPHPFQRFTQKPSYLNLLGPDLLLARKLYEVVARHPIDLIHAHQYRSLVVSLLVASRTGHRVVFDTQTLLQSELPDNGRGLPRPVTRDLGRWLDHRLPHRAAHVIAASVEAEQGMLNGVGLSPAQVTLVLGGVDSGHFEPTPGDSALQPSGERTLVYAGKLDPYHGIDHMLWALKKVCVRRPDVRLHIVTDSSFEPYERLAEELGVRQRIRLRSADMNWLPHYLVCADVALNPRTTCGGYPRELLNYLSAGKAIVSFAGSTSDFDSRRVGLVVEDGDTDAFARAILLLLENPVLAIELGLKAKEYAAVEFAWSAAARKSEEVYHRVLDQAERDNTDYVAHQVQWRQSPTKLY